MIDESDATDISLLERRLTAAERPVVLRSVDRPVVVEPALDTPVDAAPDDPAPGDGGLTVEVSLAEAPARDELRLVETLDDAPAVPEMRDGEVVDAVSVAEVETSLTLATVTSLNTLQVGPFQISDLSQDDVVSAIVAGAMSVRHERAWVSYALHVGGLNKRYDTAYLDAMSRADLVYADGMSVIVLAKLAGARAAERAGTTDIGWTVMRQLSEALGRPAKVALVGGPDGLTRRAARVIEAEVGVEVVLAEHGYHDDWSEVLTQLTESGCDMVFVGLGAPQEMKWVDEHVSALPPCLVMTCGGWFGFITQDEKRAPQWVCAAGLEWTYRLMQSPRRLFRRYAKGAVSTAELAFEIRRTKSRTA